jgi:hypothetical protein
MTKHQYLVPIEEALHYPIFAGQTVYAFDGLHWVTYYEGADVTPQGLFAIVETTSPNLIAEPGDAAPVYVGANNPWPPPPPQLTETIAQYVGRTVANAA